MIHTKKWIYMLAFLIINLITISVVDARTLTVSDSEIVPTNILDTFKGYYDWQFEYFPYSCTYSNTERICYFAFDEDGNFIDITYQNINNYSYDYKITKGIDDNIQIVGNTLKWVNWYLVILVTIVFMVGTLFVFKLITGGF